MPEAGTARQAPADLGAERTAGANAPVRPGGELAVFVVDGALDLFIEDLTGSVDGRRHFVASLGPGTLFWTGPGAAAPEGWELIGLGLPGTRVVEVPADRLTARLGPEDLLTHAERVAVMVGGAPTGSAEVPTETTAVRLQVAQQALRAAVRSTAEKALQQARADTVRLSHSHDRQDEQLARSLRQLADVVDLRGRDVVEAGDQSAQLGAALVRIGRELGHDLGGRLPRPAPGTDPVTAALRASGCRWRVVTLDDGWWRRAGVPLLGFSDGGRAPVALVPRGSRYVLDDPSTGRDLPVDARVAARVARTAYAVHPSLSAGITPGVLLRVALGRVRRELVSLALFGLLAGLITLIVPMTVALVFDRVLPARSSGLLLAVTGLVAGAAVSWALVLFTQTSVSVRLTARLAALLDPAVTDRLLRLPPAFLRQFDTGDLATRAGGLQLIRQQLAGGVLTSLLLLIFSTVNLLVLFVYSPLLGVAGLAVVATLVGLLLVLNLRALRHQTAMYVADGEISSMLYQVVTAMDKVRAAGAEQRLMTRWADRFRLREREANAAGRAQAWVSAVTAAVPSVLALVVYSVVATTLLGELSSGEFLAATASLGQFTSALTGMTLTIGPLLSTVPLWRRLAPLLTEPTEQVGTEDPGVLQGRLSLRAVSFGYGPVGTVPGSRTEAPTLVLSGIDLDVEPGELVAITGTSGSGKSTLLRLMLGLEEPTTGVVRYDGTDLKSLDAREVRRQAGVVMQNARPLPGTILDTILGAGEGTEADAWAAAEGAALAADIRRLPMGMHTIIGEGGATFSGGQLQRLMIARALCRRPRILFLDEATSALDDRTQEQVSRHLNQLDVTRVVVAHRLSTIRRADRVVVLDGGRIVQQGHYQELAEADGPFRRLVTRQLV